MWRLDDDDDSEEGNSEESRLERGLLAKLLQARTIIIAETVTDGLYRKVASMLTVLESMDPDAPVTVYVNSPGGSADSGFAIYDLFGFSRCPIITIANGVVASSAVLIYLGGDRERVSLPSARFLLHQPSTFARGQASDIEITAQEIIKLRHRYNLIVEEHTGKPVDVLEKDADRDFWLSAEEAKEYGLVQRVVRKSSELDSTR